MPIRIYELAGELGVDSRELLKHARILGFDFTTPLAGVSEDDADQIRTAVQSPHPSTIRASELARELHVESRDVLECARVLGLDILSPLAGVTEDDADQIRTAVQSPHTSTIRVYEIARASGAESRDVLECARILGLDITSPLAGVGPSDADKIRELLDTRRLSTDRISEPTSEPEDLPEQGPSDDQPVVTAEIEKAVDLDEPMRRPITNLESVETGPAGDEATPTSSDKTESDQAIERDTGETQDTTVILPAADETSDDQASGSEPDDSGDTDPDEIHQASQDLESESESQSQRSAAVGTGVPESVTPGGAADPESQQSGNAAASIPDIADPEPGPTNSGSSRDRPVRNRRHKLQDLGITIDGPRRSAPVMPVAPSHHLPSGRFHIAYLLLLATIFAIPFEESVKVPGLGTLAKALGLAAFAAWFLGVLVSGRMRTPVLFHYLFFGFGVWTSLSLYWSLDTSATAGRIVTFFLLFALVLVIWDLCDTPEAVRGALQAYVLGTWVASISVFVSFAQNNQVKYGRFAADGAADPNVMALFLAIGLPIAWYLYLNAQNRYARWVNLAYMPAGVLAMALTGSRGGFIVGSVALVYVVMTIPRKKPIAFVSTIIVLIGAAVIVVMLVPAESFERIGTVDESIASGDLNGRTEIWQRAWDVYVEHPLLGTGAGSTRRVLGLDKVGHNVGVTAGLELGVIGAVLLAAIIFVVFRRALSMRRPERRMWLTVLIMWMIGGISLDLATKKVTWLLFGLLVAAAVTELAASSSRRSMADESVTVIETAPGRLS